MVDEVVVGIYLERHGGALMQAVASDTGAGQKQIAPTDFQEFTWDARWGHDAEDGIKRMASAVAKIGPKLKTIALASYGPFKSHRRTTSAEKYTGRDFGIIASASHMPLRGFNLRALFQEGISRNGGNDKALITIHTDAEACAIGEAITQGISEDEVLAYFIVTEGIGLGVVQGRRPLSSALHSEVGMLHVRCQRKDPLRPPKEYGLYARSLSEMAANQSLRQRFAIKNNLGEINDEDIGKDHDILDLRAYYLAQACFACAVILAPHKIVLGADLSEANIAGMTEEHFFRLLNARYVDRQPVFEFDGLRKGDGYISSSQSISAISEKPLFRVTGALGMCYAAAMLKPDNGERAADVSDA